MTSPNRNWSLPRGNLSELVFRIREGRALAASWLFAGGILLFFGYGVLSFLRGWVIDHEEVLAGGVVLFFLMLGGLAGGIYLIGRITAETHYLFSTDELRVNTLFLGRSTEQIIERGQVTELVKAYTPPKAAGDSGIYSTLVIYQTSCGRQKTLALEGWQEDEQQWLSALLSAWAKLPCRSENTVAPPDSAVE